VLLATAAVVLSIIPMTAGRAATSDGRGDRICTWGGTPAAADGRFNMSPGLTNTPSTGPIHFVATGELAGGGPCTGKLTFDGVMSTGATCVAQELEGKVKGLPGVVRFWGRGAAGLVHEFLYDKSGNVVGADQPQALTDVDHGNPGFNDCNTAHGITFLNFSAVVELYTP
jgi:hypothetical protein